MHYRSAEVLNKFAKGFELENKPSTKLRKYMATAAVFELTAAPDDLGC